VANLDDAMHFYHDLLGFENKGLVQAYQMGMVSAGGWSVAFAVFRPMGCLHQS
jgi:hypothetical protein